MVKSVTVSLSRELLDAIFEGARRLYPRETILLLRGKKSKDSISVLELVVPPLATYGRGFADVPLHMLPMDFRLLALFIRILQEIWRLRMWILTTSSGEYS
jgi:hypothetical protein